MNTIGISTDCLCDLPAGYLRANSVEVMQFYIHTATGRFLNEREISSDDILKYLQAGNQFLVSSVPEPEECKAYFEALLTRYEAVIHITASDKIGMSHPNAAAALALMGENANRVTLVNSGSISTGLGHVVQLAVTLRDSGQSVTEIAGACAALRGKLADSFIVPNADYLYRVGYANRSIRNLCSFLSIHPVLCTKNGKLALKKFYMGNYENAVMRYIRGELKRSKRIHKGQLFITHAGCSTKLLTRVRAKADGLCRFEQVTVTKASAFVCGCYGPNAVGVLYIHQ